MRAFLLPFYIYFNKQYFIYSKYYHSNYCIYIPTLIKLKYLDEKGFLCAEDKKE